MLKPGFLIFVLMVNLLGSLWSGVHEMSYLGANAENASLAPLFATYIAVMSLDIGKVATLVLSGQLLQGIYNFFTFNYAFLTGNWQIVRWVYTCITAGVAVTLTFQTISILRGGGG